MQRVRLKCYPQSNTKKKKKKKEKEPDSSFQIQCDKKCYTEGFQGGAYVTRAFNPLVEGLKEFLENGAFD